MKQKDKQGKDVALQKISFRRLVYEALPELWLLQIVAVIVISLLVFPLNRLISAVLGTKSVAITTGNLGELLGWQTPVIIILVSLIALVYISLELFSHIYLTGEILYGRDTSIARTLKLGFQSMGRFLCPAGIPVLLYILIAVPLGGLGFSVGLTKGLRIPNFIMDAIVNTPLYLGLYIVVMLVLFAIGLRWFFVVHGVVIGGLSPRNAKYESSQIIKEHWKEFLSTALRIGLAVAFVSFFGYLFFTVLPHVWLASIGEQVPNGVVVDINKLVGSDGGLSEAEALVLIYRFLCFFVVLLGLILTSSAMLLAGSYAMLRFSRFYLEITGRVNDGWLERPKRRRYWARILFLVFMAIFAAIASVFLALGYHSLVDKEDVKIIAHRAGGVMAPENSIEGLYAAIEHGCYASEIDVQRTKDGVYVINHDDTFMRVAGDSRGVSDMTFEEVKKLQIQDLFNGGDSVHVPTLDEALDTIKGKERLLIELKGSTADEKMADDVVAMVREKDCLSDVVIISLKYDVIDYTETKYPEFDTGLLFFAGMGDITSLNCDYLVLEEEIATYESALEIHQANKQVIVWTVDIETDMHKFLNESIDAIITDEVELAQKVQQELDDRDELQVIEDLLNGN